MLDVLTETLSRGGQDKFRGAAALRLRVRLQPAAGHGGRLMPPTYSGSDGPIYLTEERRIEDANVRCVMLDGQASQSNRLEEGLIALIADGRVNVPDVAVDQAEFGRHSALEFSHRVFDSHVEDALDGDVRFGETAMFARLASVINRGVAGPLVERFPVGLLLGVWASRRSNPQGSTRLARAVTSEIIGYGFLAGQRPASKIDLQHVSSAVKLLPTDATELARYEVARDARAKGAKRPSEYGYGNVVPSAAQHGGGTVRFAEQQTVISLAALRAVRTAELGSGQPSSPETDFAARELLVLLAVSMLEAQLETGWDLRSGCHLVPEAEPTIELVGRLGDVVESTPLIGLGAVDRLAERSQAAASLGLKWDTPPLELTASPQQLELLRRSMGLPPEESPAG